MTDAERALGIGPVQHAYQAADLPGLKPVATALWHRLGQAGACHPLELGVRDLVGAVGPGVRAVNGG